VAVIILFVLLVVVGCGAPEEAPDPIARWQGKIAGEVTQDSVILQARLTEDGKVRSGDVKGRPGVGAFALSTDEGLQDAQRTRWLAASAENDYMVKTLTSGLQPGTRYYYRLLSGPDEESVQTGPIGTFRTLDPVGVCVTPSPLCGRNRHEPLRFPGLGPQEPGF
jgi:phosphodiesterase/alkaline phosphatase D-like protein